MKIFNHKGTQNITILALFLLSISLFNTVYANTDPYTEEEYLNDLANSVINPGNEYTDEQYLDSLVHAVFATDEKEYTDEDYVNSLVESIYGGNKTLTKYDFATH